MFKFLIFAVLVTAAVARRSPNADFAEKYFQKYGGRYSTDVIEDALLDVNGKQADGPPDGKWQPSPIDMSSTMDMRCHF